MLALHRDASGVPAHVAVGVLVRRRRHWSRLAALMLGSVDLLLLPYGTALGVYALWVLLREDTKRLFEEPVTSLIYRLRMLMHR